MGITNLKYLFYAIVKGVITTKYKQFLPNLDKSLRGRERTREIVRIRDNHTCQDCGAIWKQDQRRFDVHHLNGLCGKLSRSYDKVATISGLITYCHRCHMSKHAQHLSNPFFMPRERIKSPKDLKTKDRQIEEMISKWQDPVYRAIMCKKFSDAAKRRYAHPTP